MQMRYTLSPFSSPYSISDQFCEQISSISVTRLEGISPSYIKYFRMVPENLWKENASEETV
jgi:hypothetical protein